MQTVFETIKDIAIKIDHAIKTEDLGYSDSENSSGEDQLKLDVKSDYIIEEAFKSVSIVKALVSEEKEGVLALHDDGKYTICYDPLDGSSLADVNLSVGSIFGIYEGELKAENLVASAYVVYGPRIASILASALYITAVVVSFIPPILGMVSVIYIPLVLICDIGFVSSSISLTRKYDIENAGRIKKRVLIWMLFGLIAFIAGSVHISL